MKLREWMNEWMNAELFTPKSLESSDSLSVCLQYSIYREKSWVHSFCHYSRYTNHNPARQSGLLSFLLQVAHVWYSSKGVLMRNLISKQTD